MSDWESDGDDVKQPAAPVQSQRFDQNRGYGSSPNRGGYNQNRNNAYNNGYGDGQRDRQDYGSNQRNSNQQFDQRRDNRQSFGGGRQNQDRGGGIYGGNDLRIQVDSSKLGIVIGKGGSKIREIQETNNVNVKIGKLKRRCCSAECPNFVSFHFSRSRTK